MALESPTSDAERVAAARSVLCELVEHRVGRADQVEERSGSVIWTWGDPHRAPLILGHLDTVWPVGTLEKFPFAVEGDLVRGPGTFDMKAGLVIAIHALAKVMGNGPSSRPAVRLVVTGDEETGSTQSRALIEELAVDAGGVLCMEGAAPGGALKVARKGTAHYLITVTGRAAHAGLEPERGINAVVELGDLVRELPNLCDVEAGTSVTPTVVSGGSVRNVVPETAEVVVDVRASTVAEFERVERALNRRASRPSLAGAAIAVGGGIGRPPMEERVPNKLMEEARRVNARLGRPELVGVAVGGASDANYSAALGVPTLDGLGAVGGGAHAHSEHIELIPTLERIDLVAGLLE